MAAAVAIGGLVLIPPSPASAATCGNAGAMYQIKVGPQSTMVAQHDHVYLYAANVSPSNGYSQVHRLRSYLPGQVGGSNPTFDHYFSDASDHHFSQVQGGGQIFNSSGVSHLYVYARSCTP